MPFEAPRPPARRELDGRRHRHPRATLGGDVKNDPLCGVVLLLPLDTMSNEGPHWLAVPLHWEACVRLVLQ
jgi:hypothetical protein